jgi:hypothetical protein
MAQAKLPPACQTQSRVCIASILPANGKYAILELRVEA